jgi:hypothetical protein
MEFSPDQCRAGRALLGWTVDQLATAATVGTATVKRFEAGYSIRDGSRAAIGSALETAGLQLIAGGARSAYGGEGVRRSA